MVIVIVVFDPFRMMLYKILNALGLELGKDLWKGKDIWSFSTLYHPNISIHILQTIFHTFRSLLIRRSCFTIKSLFSWWSFPCILTTLYVIAGVILKGEVRSSLPLRVKGLKIIYLSLVCMGYDSLVKCATDCCFRVIPRVFHFVEFPASLLIYQFANWKSSDLWKLE